MDSCSQFLHIMGMIKRITKKKLDTLGKKAVKIYVINWDKKVQEV